MCGVYTVNEKWLYRNKTNLQHVNTVEYFERFSSKTLLLHYSKKVIFKIKHLTFTIYIIYLINMKQNQMYS